MSEEGYLLTEENKLCSEYVSVAVDHFKPCIEAAKELIKDFDMTVNASDSPKGCYLLSNKVYFNHHSTGSRKHGAHQICKSRGNVNNYFPSIHLLLISI